MIKKEKLKNREFDVHTRKIGQQNKIGEKWGFFFIKKKWSSQSRDGGRGPMDVPWTFKILTNNIIITWNILL